MNTMTNIQKMLTAFAATVGAFLMFKPTDVFAAQNLPPPLTTHTPGGGRATGIEFPRIHAPRQWTSAQVCDFVKYMKDLLAGSGLTGRPAQLFAAHVGRETRFGQQVYNNAFGNVKEYGDGPWYRHSDNLQYKSFLSPRSGINAAMAKIRDSSRVHDGHSYRSAWARLEAGEKTWYSELGLAGYYQFRLPDGSIVDTTASNVAASQTDYERSLASVERCW